MHLLAHAIRPFADAVLAATITAMNSAGDWANLGISARAFRIAHLAWGVVGMSTLGYIWLSALRRRRDRYLAASMAFLSVEGVALIIGRGNCPFGPFQAQLGDPVPMFELILPPRAAKAAVPVLAGVSLIGMALALIRPPRG